MNKLLEYFKEDELAVSVWKGKYALPDEDTPDQMHWRLAKEFARIEKKHGSDFKSGVKWSELSHYGRKRDELDEEKIYNLFKDFKYIVPQGSVMSMLGNPKIGSLSNCFIVGQPEDSYGGIFQKDQELAQLMKRRGGVGIDISTLRPKDTEVNNAAGTSTGAASFMERFSNTTREVAQSGRRGALMITIDVRHPDVFDFVNIKQDRTKVTGANISVMLRNDFMEAVKNNEDYLLRFPCTKEFEAEYPTTFEYNILTDVRHGDGTITKVKRIKAKELYDQIVHNAWDNAEPGQMFIDNHWDYSPDAVYSDYKGVTTNPCGEIFMSEYDACRLIALNLYSFVDNPFTKDAKVDYDKLYQYAYEQQRLADDLVDLEIEHIDRIIEKINNDSESEDVKTTELNLWGKVRKVASGGRRTGCGITALGDMLAALSLPYDSSKALEVIKNVFKIKMSAELDCTIDLAITRGTFKRWEADLEQDYDDIPRNAFFSMLVKEFPEQQKRMKFNGRRNVSFSTVAPTGSLSILTQTTSGLEPLFMPYYMRRKKINPADKDSRVDFTDQNGDQWQEYPVLHPKFKDWIEYKNNQASETEFLERFDVNNKESLESAFKQSPWYGSTANDIDWVKRVEIQSIIQKYTTHSISSTINLPNDVSKEEVSKIYLKAYEKSLKGVTVYRDGCRTGVLVNESSRFEQHHAPKRPKTLPVHIHTTVSKGTKYNVLVGLFEDKPYEVFAVPYFTDIKQMNLVKKGKGKYDLELNGKIVSSNVLSEMSDTEEAITRLISTSLRHGAEIKFIVEQLKKTSGDITVFSKAIARVLKKYIENQAVTNQEFEDCKTLNECNLVYSEGCLQCKTCGKSKC